MPSQPCLTSVELLECRICGDNKQYKGQRGLAIHTARRHGTRMDVDPPLPSASQPAPSSPVIVPTPTSNRSTTLTQKLGLLKANTPIIKRIPRGARISVASCLTKCVAKVVAENSPAAWERLLTFSYTVLHIDKNNKESLTNQIKSKTLSPPELLTNLVHHHSIRNADHHYNKIKTIESKLSEGNVSGAARLLFSNDDLASHSAETFAALRAKHPVPSASSQLPDPPGPDVSAASVSVDAVHQAILSFPNGSAGGLDGLSPQHLKDLTTVPSGDTGAALLIQLTALINLMLSGLVNAEVVPLLYGANLIALAKKDGGIRPIAVGCTFRRLASKLCCRKFHQTLTNIFKPRQLGFGVKGGCEAAVHAARTFLSRPDYEVFIKIDVQNAFNSVDRGALLSEVKKELPDIYNYLWQCYGAPTKLLFGDNIILSSMGCQQGDPLGPAIFSLAVHPIISNLKSSFNLWYLDDGSLGGDAETVLQDLHLIIDRFSDIGLSLNFTKCEIYLPSHLSPEKKIEILTNFNAVLPNISVHSNSSLSLLGSPIFDEAINPIITCKLNLFNNTSELLFQINPHMALFIIRFCLFTPKFMYLIRSCPIWKFPSILSAIDDSLQSTLSKVLNISFDFSSWSQAVLPIRFGGLGVRSSSSVALPAFLSSAYGSMSLVSIILNKPQILDTEIASLAEARRAWCDSCPGADVPDSMHVQRAWDTPRLKVTHASLLANSPDDSDRARILAVSASESGHWLHALPSRNVGTVLDPSCLRISVCLRLGARICVAHTCNCGRAVDQLGRHGLSCHRSAGRLYRHGTLNDLIRRSLATASVPAILEPVGLARDDGKRPDGATLVPWKLGRALVWDVTCVDTFAQSHIQGTRSQAGAAADQAQVNKRRKYSSLLKDYDFAALAVETLGPWSSDMRNFIKALSSRLVQATGDPRAGAYLSQRISIAIQRGNAASVMGSMPQSDLLEAVFFL